MCTFYEFVSFVLRTHYKSLLGHIFLDYKVVSELYSEGHIEHKIINELMLRLFVVPLVIIII